MNVLKQIYTRPELLIIPIIGGLTSLIILLIVLGRLRRRPAQHRLTAVYLFGTAVLSLWIFVTLLFGDLQHRLPRPLINVVHSILLVCWAYVVIEIGDAFVLVPWMRRNGIIIPQLVRDIVRGLFGLLIVLFVLAMLFNIDPGSIAISSTVLSAVLGLALQDMLKNVIAGIALQIERPFAIGHEISVDGTAGRVSEMNWRATRLITNDEHVLIYPNAKLAESSIVNLSLPVPKDEG